MASHMNKSVAERDGKKVYMHRSKRSLQATGTGTAETGYRILGEALRKEIKELVKESLLEVLHARDKNGEATELLTADDPAKRLKVPVSWVYERSRRNKIPTHRIGR